MGRSAGNGGITALMEAMRRGDDALARALLLAGADVELVDQFGKTASMYACEWGHADLLVQLMADFKAALSKRAVVCARDQWGHSLMMYACMRGDAALVEVLVRNPSVELGPSN